MAEPGSDDMTPGTPLFVLTEVVQEAVVSADGFGPIRDERRLPVYRRISKRIAAVLLSNGVTLAPLDRTRAGALTPEALARALWLLMKRDGLRVWSNGAGDMPPNLLADRILAALREAGERPASPWTGDPADYDGDGGR